MLMLKLSLDANAAISDLIFLFFFASSCVCACVSVCCTDASRTYHEPHVEDFADVDVHALGFVHRDPDVDQVVVVVAAAELKQRHQLAVQRIPVLLLSRKQVPFVTSRSHRARQA